ncbi:hypothetical protein PBAT_24570 [Paenibacillus antarcticus]|uniref:Uncharacterized protein n=1 Tax=Paenibacillus antarcticus TaxID=253703 RepID=A0A168JD45_9BACL|nr:hypothetical protein PBAT_24570 [Paenibacillus antarcticus]
MKPVIDKRGLPCSSFSLAVTSIHFIIVVSKRLLIGKMPCKNLSRIMDLVWKKDRQRRKIFALPSIEKSGALTIGDDIQSELSSFIHPNVTMCCVIMLRTGGPSQVQPLNQTYRI